MRRRIWWALVLSASLAPCAIGQSTTAVASPAPFPLYVKVQLDKAVKLSSLKPGDVTEGNLARDVYSADGKVFSAGSHVRLTVDHVERKRRARTDRWPWLVQLFMPRYQNFPSFNQASVSVLNGLESELQVSLLSASLRTEVHAEAKKRKERAEDATVKIANSVGSTGPESRSPDAPRSPSGPIMALEAHQTNPAANLAQADLAFAEANSVTLPAGTTCRVLLLNGISASKNRPGDAIRARLLEPIELDSHTVLPTGSIFDGSVVRATPPRMLSRAGSLLIDFTGVTLPAGRRIPVSASLTGVEVNRGSHTKIDAEGRLHGDRPGVAWMLINGGVTAGIAKEVDDGTQLILEAILSGATDASTAGAARIAGTVVSGIFMLTRHGRDVILPSRTEMGIVLNRPLTLSGESGASANSLENPGAPAALTGKY